MQTKRDPFECWYSLADSAARLGVTTRSVSRARGRSPHRGREGGVSRQRAKQLQNQAAGLCEKCSTPAAPKSNGQLFRYCLWHVLQSRESQRKRVRCKRRWRGAASYWFTGRPFYPLTPALSPNGGEGVIGRRAA